VPKAAARDVRPSPFRAWQHRRYRRFFVGTTAAQFGFWFSHVSYQTLMSDLTDDELWLAALFVATFLPVTIIGPFGGVLVDRFDRKRVLLGTYVLITIVASVQALLTSLDLVNPIMLLVTASGVGTGLAFLGPASGAITANTVPATDLSSAISLGSMASNLSRVVGPAAVAPLVAARMFEVTWVMYATAAIVALIVTSGVTLLPYDSDIDDAPLRERFRSGIRHARERQPAAQALALTAAGSVLGVSHVVVLPNFTEQALGRPSADFVWMGVATGLGSLIGAGAAGSIAGNATLRRAASMLIPYSVLVLLFSRSTSFPLAIGLQVAIGFFYFAGMTTIMILVQQVVNEEFRGRVMSLLQIAWAGLVPLGSLLMGVLAGESALGLGSANAIGISALLCLAWTVVVFLTAGRYDTHTEAANTR